MTQGPSRGPAPTSRQLTGARSEALALRYLQRRGLRLIARNYRAPRLGEIDLVMRSASRLQSRVLVFVEVRYRAGQRFGGAPASVTPAKQHRLLRAAAAFQQSDARFCEWPARFDVVAIAGSLEKPVVTWIRNAFEC